MNTPGQLYKLFEERETPLSDADMKILQSELQRVIDFLRVVGERRLANTFMREMESIERVLEARSA